MVSSKDRALIEARAQGLDLGEALRHPFRQMLKLDVLGSAFAISVFLITYYIAVGFFPVFFETIFGYSQSKANALGNWFWAFNAGALLVVGFLSDRVRVRKPFMLLGAICGDRLHHALRPPRDPPGDELHDLRDPAEPDRGLAGDRLRALDGRLHRDGRAPQPGADRDRPGGLGADHPRRHRGLGLLRPQGGDHGHAAGREGAGGQGVLADPTPVGKTTIGQVATAAADNPDVTAKLKEITGRDEALLGALQANPAVAKGLAEAQAAGTTPTPAELAAIKAAIGPEAFAELIKPTTPADLEYVSTVAPEKLGAANFAALSAPTPALTEALATLEADGPGVRKRRPTRRNSGAPTSSSASAARWCSSR